MASKNIVKGLNFTQYNCPHIVMSLAFNNISVLTE